MADKLKDKEKVRSSAKQVSSPGSQSGKAGKAKAKAATATTTRSSQKNSHIENLSVVRVLNPETQESFFVSIDAKPTSSDKVFSEKVQAPQADQSLSRADLLAILSSFKTEVHDMLATERQIALSASLPLPPGVGSSKSLARVRSEPSATVTSADVVAEPTVVLESSSGSPFDKFLSGSQTTAPPGPLGAYVSAGGVLSEVRKPAATGASPTVSAGSRNTSHKVLGEVRKPVATGSSPTVSAGSRNTSHKVHSSRQPYSLPGYGLGWEEHMSATSGSRTTGSSGRHSMTPVDADAYQSTAGSASAFAAVASGGSMVLPSAANTSVLVVGTHQPSASGSISAVSAGLTQAASTSSPSVSAGMRQGDGGSVHRLPASGNFSQPFPVSAHVDSTGLVSGSHPSDDRWDATEQDEEEMEEEASEADGDAPIRLPARLSALLTLAAEVTTHYFPEGVAVASSSAVPPPSAFADFAPSHEQSANFKFLESPSVAFQLAKVFSNDGSAPPLPLLSAHGEAPASALPWLASPGRLAHHTVTANRKIRLANSGRNLIDSFALPTAPLPVLSNLATIRQDGYNKERLSICKEKDLIAVEECGRSS
ncbi:hypothetical protein V1264_021815 [Littorina saxatilis]|uniref:Uncharacterized protein n=1 Tax=Littorina saxatilis TaxID=31220 RepID=A0AAN9FWG9_9CAEN